MATCDISGDVLEVVVPGEDHARLLAVLDDLRAEYDRADNPRFLRRLYSLGHLLPAEVRGPIRDMRHLETAAALVVRDSPLTGVDPGPTPDHWRNRRSDATAPHDFWLALVSAQLGDAVCWSSLQDGRLLADVLPIPGEERQQTGHGSKAELEFHVEDAFHDDRCDGLALLCLRNPESVPTTIASAAGINLSTLDLDVLFEPRFLIRPDPEHLRGATTDVAVSARPVLFGSRQSPYLRVDPAYTEPLPGDGAAREAFDALCRQLDAATVDVALAPGDILLVDNYRAVHGRRPFDARYDGNDRWLRKMTVVRDLRQSRHRRSETHTRALSPA